MFPDVNLNDFDYNLPTEKIAEFPIEDRSNSKLLYANKNEKVISSFLFFNKWNYFFTDSTFCDSLFQIIS
mgnify:CR=1 FL=1